jgi:hypothetical protein
VGSPHVGAESHFHMQPPKVFQPQLPASAGNASSTHPSLCLAGGSGGSSSEAVVLTRSEGSGPTPDSRLHGRRPVEHLQNPPVILGKDLGRSLLKLRHTPWLNYRVVANGCSPCKEETWRSHGATLSHCHRALSSFLFLTAQHPAIPSITGETTSAPKVDH